MFTVKINFRDESVEDPIDALEIFELIRDINDPEHPYTLEQLNVVQEELIRVQKDAKHTYVDVRFTPTIPHCSMATLIGLAIRVKLARSLHPRIKFRHDSARCWMRTRLMVSGGCGKM
ncbi:hypothetical protein TELCIR_08718 [Teladorsagia circumcincta]|uniref:MIP18 family-like domain-containing protein n=1 Tax=Teladorsagia circumcincta TaxID=45464 RepID=A0A2G9UIY4_TELCI|nr:hypothetical protein TELCIR_08718 [Teladorsagia circumcincta]